MNAVKIVGTLAACSLLLVAATACDKYDKNADTTASRSKPASSYGTDSSRASASHEADNTARNAEPGPTALDQGNSEADLTTTQKIRQAVMDENALSMTAKNVKIITRDGKVWLRGPVNASTEKSRIEELAIQVAGAGNVTSEIELVTPRG